MTYRIAGLDPADFLPLFALDDVTLAARGATRVVATADRGFPCRASLDDARKGETLILTHHVSHDVATPYRSAYAIYVREDAESAAVYVDALPPVFDGRSIALRGFDAEGMLRKAQLVLDGDGDAKIRDLFDDEEAAYIHAHNAAPGCFAARIERDGDVR